MAHSAHSKTRTLDYLRRRPLANVLHLKMLVASPALVHCTHFKDDRGEGVLLESPPSALSFDAAHYADFDIVAMPVADSPELLAELISGTRGPRRVFKLLGERDEIVVARQFEGRRVRCFDNYTAPDPGRYAADASVRVERALDASLTDMLTAGGRYRRDDLRRLFAEGGMALTVREGSALAAAALTAAALVYRCFEHIWEIAALHTEHGARRNGHAERIVRSALAHLAEHGHTPRYVVDPDNGASVALADKLGLERFARVVHFVCDGN